MLIFLFYFFGQYLQVFLEQKLGEENLRLGGTFTRSLKPEVLMRSLRTAMQLNGSADTYGNFLWFEGYIVVIILAFIGSVLIGNDFHHGSLPFYLVQTDQPLALRRGQMLGRRRPRQPDDDYSLPAALRRVRLHRSTGITTVDQFQLLLGILGYGAVLTVTLVLVLMATVTWLRRTIPMVMIWITIFVLGRLMQRWLVDGLRLPEHWRLIDLWNDMYLTGMWIMGKDHATLRPLSQIQPPYWEGGSRRRRRDRCLRRLSAPPHSGRGDHFMNAELGIADRAEFDPKSEFPIRKPIPPSRFFFSNKSPNGTARSSASTTCRSNCAAASPAWSAPTAPARARCCGWQRDSSKPSLGRVTVRGLDAWEWPAKRHVGYCPDVDAFYEEMSGREFVSTMARLVRLRSLGKLSAHAKRFFSASA